MITIRPIVPQSSTSSPDVLVNDKPKTTGAAMQRPQGVDETGAMPSAEAARAAQRTVGVDRAEPIDTKVQKLLAKMTLEEKVLQLVQPADTGAATGPTTGDEALSVVYARRGVGSFLNVPGPERVRELQTIALKESRLGIPLLICHDDLSGHRFQYAIPLAQAASFRPSVAYTAAEMTAKDARDGGVALTFAPMLDHPNGEIRDGRIVEGWGESTHHIAEMGAASIAGFHRHKVATCMKHPLGYGNPAGGVDYAENTADEGVIHNKYMPPFERAAVEGNEGSMSGFNVFRGVPSTAQPLPDALLTKDMVEITDYTAIKELIQHGIAGGATQDEAEQMAVLKAFAAGRHIDMVSGLYEKWLPKLVADGFRGVKIPPTAIDEAAGRVLRLKYKLGLFENPFPSPADRGYAFTAEQKRIGTEIAEQCMVLLKNEPHTDGRMVLPLAKSAKNIAVIGPLAASKRDVIGQWRAMARDEDAVSILEGMQERAGKDRTVTHAKGCEVMAPGTPEMRAEAQRLAEQADVVVLVLGETRDMNGEASTRLDPCLPEAQLELAQMILELGKPVAVVLSNGRPLTNLGFLKEKAPAILESWQAGTMTGTAVANTLFGEDANGRAVNPGGKLPLPIQPHVGYAGNTFDRLTSGRPADMPGADRWYVRGNAAFNPDGTRDTREVKTVEPLWPFGFGLSYTKFEVGTPTAVPNTYRGNPTTIDSIELPLLRREGFTIRVPVTNSGDQDGDQTVHLFVQDVTATEPQPIKKHIGSVRVTLARGESKTVELQVSAEDLSFYSQTEKERVLEPGEFRFRVGTSADDRDLSMITVNVTNTPLGEKLATDERAGKPWQLAARGLF